MQKTFSTFAIKTIDEEQRVVTGICSTPSVDLMGDIVEPMGITNLKDGSWPFLLDHDHARAVGTVEMLRPSPKGIEFRAQIAKPSSPGRVAELCAEAWDLLKSGLRRGISIGFVPVEAERLPSGGQWIKAWRLLEISAVSVAAQPEAYVTALKSARKSTTSRRRGSRPMIIDEKKYLRRARAVLVHAFGERAVPRFNSITDLEKFEAEKDRQARSRGAIYLGWRAIAAVMPKKAPTRVIRLRAR